VILQNTGDKILLSVSDDGCGFDTQSEVMTKGLGFTSMRERLRIVSGEIQICSQAKRGTLIKVSVPVTYEVHTAHA
jgi:signal transduction histidine kinase